MDTALGVSHIIGYGDEGNDTLVGASGTDTLYGGAGDDTMWVTVIGKNELYGGEGNDTLAGSSVSDILSSYSIVDRLYGGDGDDFIYSQVGTSSFAGYGGEGNDKIVGSSDYNLLYGGGGNDELWITPGTGSGNKVLNGDDGDDTLSGGADSGWGDRYYGGAGNDMLYGGAYYQYGGDGNDVFTIIDAGKRCEIYGGTGEDTIYVPNRTADDIDQLFGDLQDQFYSVYFKDGSTLVLKDVETFAVDGKIWQLDPIPFT